MTRCKKLKAYVVFIKPGSLPQDWEKSALWHRARTIPGVTPVTDADQRLARRFGATTSGGTFLYAPDGKLVFSGGITAGRGHEGDNQGLDVISSLVTSAGSARLQSTPVFGCALEDVIAPNREFR